ncbi:hypothetical protein DYY67_1416 [Candidatus Nitrosotalea sp. TS]|uniref:hypothetical protein n=1 Tax=Candidatus Nitrosotalea sp. TS TaxID=2341020 RepID=UPI00140BC1D2|nr:hypothetical protein [Candidatus Nitrosotalea sp. TS]NHI04041.1 hypothetical protein [Candidatus Nitrosotalea sp. TS]
MLRNTIDKTQNSDEFLKILIQRRKNKLGKIVEKLAKKNNPKLLSIMKVEDLFKDYIEFDSRSQLLRKLEGSMKAAVLNTIIARLVLENKIVVNDDHSLTWIDTEGNRKLNKQFDTAIPL